jgi:hypothetical protein
LVAPAHSAVIAIASNDPAAIAIGRAALKKATTRSSGVRDPITVGRSEHAPIGWRWRRKSPNLTVWRQVFCAPHLPVPRCGAAAFRASSISSELGVVMRAVSPGRGSRGFYPCLADLELNRVTPVAKEASDEPDGIHHRCHVPVTRAMRAFVI